MTFGCCSCWQNESSFLKRRRFNELAGLRRLRAYRPPSGSRTLNTVPAPPCPITLSDVYVFVAVSNSIFAMNSRYLSMYRHPARQRPRSLKAQAPPADNAILEPAIARHCFTPALQSIHAPCRFRLSISVAAHRSFRAGKAQVHARVHVGQG